ncbi:MAG TPA: hypothetical protein VGJ75_24110 [Dongiaceae bacterium]
MRGQHAHVARKIVTLVVLFTAILASCLALILTFVAAPHYEQIFIAIMVCNVLAILATLFLARTKLHRGWIVAFALLIIYTSSDVGLRYFAGARLFDAF